MHRRSKAGGRSDRVKCVDLHPTEPWVLSALLFVGVRMYLLKEIARFRYSGNIFLWDTETCSLIKSWEICELPVRSCKFIARRSQFICASGAHSRECITHWHLYGA
jgi:coatomer subunit beta'